MRMSFVLATTWLISIPLLGCAKHLPAADVDRFWSLQAMRSFEPPQGPTTCPRHGVPLQEGEAMVRGGMCVESPEYMRAKLDEFPYGYVTVSSCSCDDRGGYVVPRMFCPVCRGNEQKWLKKHEYAPGSGR